MKLSRITNKAKSTTPPAKARGGLSVSRKDSLLRLYNRLLAQRESLRQKIADDLGLAYTPDDGINDIGETAHHVEQTELHSQLAALESRELRQIEAAIGKIRDGTYGTCDRCKKAIPIARLQALPFGALCIECQRKREQRRNADAEEEAAANWASAMEYERRSVDRELSLSDFDQS
jgi:DnaK suppressor protein